MIQLSDSDLRRAAADGMDAFISLFADAYLGALGGTLTADNMALLSAPQHTLLAYRILRDELMEGGFCQLIQNQITHTVIFPNIELQMNMMTCGTNISNQCRQHILPPNKQMKLILRIRERHTLAPEKIDELTMLLGNIRNLHSEITVSRTTSQLYGTGSADKYILLVITPKEEINDQSQDRHRRHNQNPCYGLDGLTII